MKLKGKASKAGLIDTMLGADDDMDAIEENSEGEGSEEGSESHHTESVSEEEGVGTYGSMSAIQDEVAKPPPPQIKNEAEDICKVVNKVETHLQQLRSCLFSAKKANLFL